jgi:hypothetical protein
MPNTCWQTAASSTHLVILHSFAVIWLWLFEPPIQCKLADQQNLTIYSSYLLVPSKHQAAGTKSNIRKQGNQGWHLAVAYMLTCWI